MSLNNPNPAGPISKPALKKPNTGLESKALKKGTINIVAHKNIKRSLPRGSNCLASFIATLRSTV